VPNFVSVVPSIAEVPHGEKSHTQSLTHSPSLFDVPGTEAFASEHILKIQPKTTSTSWTNTAVTSVILQATKPAVTHGRYTASNVELYLF